jgi:hypothetical protein
MSPEQWQILSSVASVITTILFVAGLFLALYELRESRKARQLQAVERMLTELGDLDLRKARWHLSRVLTPPYDPSHLDKDTVDAIEIVFASFDKVGLLVKYGFLPKDIILDMYAESIFRAWSRTQLYLDYMARQRRQENYMPFFRYLAKEAETFLRRNRPRYDLADLGTIKQL